MKVERIKRWDNNLGVTFNLFDGREVELCYVGPQDLDHAMIRLMEKTDWVKVPKQHDTHHKALEWFINEYLDSSDNR